jgi:hypothetical protein
MKAYEEIVEFIAGNNPDSVIAFHPSEEAKKRIADLINKEKETGLSSEEKAELEHFLELEHIMRLAKARARQYIENE